MDLSRARCWIETLPADVARVLIGVNPSLTQALEWIADQTFHAVQLHGAMGHPFVSRLMEGRALIAAISVQNERSFSDLGLFTSFTFLFYAFRPSTFAATD